MDFETQTYGEKLAVTLIADRLDAGMAIRFKESLKIMVDEGADHMILDLSNVAFMDSSGLGALVGHMKYMGAERAFELCGLTPTVEKVFKLTRMDTVFKIYTTLQDATAEGQQLAG